jgi:hypothetical protein
MHMLHHAAAQLQPTRPSPKHDNASGQLGAITLPQNPNPNLTTSDINININPAGISISSQFTVHILLVWMCIMRTGHIAI